MDLIYFGRDCDRIECDVIYQYVLKIDGEKANGDGFSRLCGRKKLTDVC